MKILGKYQFLWNKRLNAVASISKLPAATGLVSNPIFPPGNNKPHIRIKANFHWTAYLELVKAQPAHISKNLIFRPALCLERNPYLDMPSSSTTSGNPFATRNTCGMSAAFIRKTVGKESFIDQPAKEALRYQNEHCREHILFAERPRSVSPTRLWHQRLLGSRRAKSAEIVGITGGNRDDLCEFPKISLRRKGGVGVWALTSGILPFSSQDL